MARKKIIPDAAVFAEVISLLHEGGGKAVSFGAVGQAVGLAPSTLVQRFGSCEGMQRSAILAAWEGLEAATDLALAAAHMNAKGAHAILKALGQPTEDQVCPWDHLLLASDFRDPEVRGRAKAWRRKLEAALARRLGGADAETAAALLFAAWQGSLLWQGAGGKGFKLKDALRAVSV